ncbi:4-amino-4-deoxy-L-arabinose transferase [Bacillus sp. AFS002410]|uniref:ArnT family glycosyltransferase n=1 Tax=Bacillus sp. AFS002410 TaxID=2033481 RepID=UPI000BF231BF|nr:glycosyltransferase family 39 protein [Bacillus sp. AFS002410]PEJ57796.1 4-amino-4-deoxy-L-arabinose transferase [Bacillus sp. AFS002410]
MFSKWKSRLDIPFVLIVLLSAILNGYNIWTDKYVNSYYTSAVASMLQSFHNFFFASFDPGGYVTVDKPPVTFWIQTISAYIFGLHGWSVILPQALSGIGSVCLIYVMVKPTFGKTAARLSALAIAITPVLVAVSRTNNIDSMLVFTLLLASWFLFKGLKKNKLWYVLVAFAMIGVGFNEKMLQAYMVLPAFYLLYWVAAKVNWKKKLGIMAIATSILLAVSLSWAVIVDSIPASKRPYVGSSQTNSVLELAFGYNGVSRLLGMDGGGGNQPSQSTSKSQSSTENSASQNDGTANNSNNAASSNLNNTASNNSNNATSSNSNNTVPTNESTQGQNGMPEGFPNFDGGTKGKNSSGMFNTGTAGPFRLFQSELSGQASWLIPFVLFGLVGIFIDLRKKNFTQKHKEALFWTAWLVPVMGFFSVAGFFHQYYLIMLAPPVAALAGAGWSKLFELYQSKLNWKSFLLPAAIFITAVFEWFIVHPYDSVIGIGWSIAILILGIGVTIWLSIIKVSGSRMQFIAAIIGFFVLLIGPMYWAFTPITYGQSSMLPAAGPTSSMGGFGGPGGMNGNMPDGMPGQGQQDGNAQDGMPGQGAQDGNAQNGMSGQGGQDGNTQNGTPGQGQQDGNMPSGMPGQGGQDGTSQGNMPSMPGQGSNKNSNGMGNEQIDKKTYAYLTKNNTGEKFLFATADYSTAASYIIETGKAVMAMGGFSGSDPILTVDKLEKLVKEGKVKYFMISDGMGGRGGSSEITDWIKKHGKEISSDKWQSNSDNSTGLGFPGGSKKLYKVSL